MQIVNFNKSLINHFKAPNNIKIV